MSAPGAVHQGQIVSGAAFNEPMRVETVEANGQDIWSVAPRGAEVAGMRERGARQASGGGAVRAHLATAGVGT